MTKPHPAVHTRNQSVVHGHQPGSYIQKISLQIYSTILGQMAPSCPATPHPNYKKFHKQLRRFYHSFVVHPVHSAHRMDNQSIPPTIPQPSSPWKLEGKSAGNTQQIWLIVKETPGFLPFCAVNIYPFGALRPPYFPLKPGSTHTLLC